MKVYIVTDGCYSDYMIKKVFSNHEAAEEYKYWHHINNEIEEYEINDEPFTKAEGERAMLIRVQGTVYPEAIVNIAYEISPTIISPGTITKSTGISNFYHYGIKSSFDLYTYSCIPIDNWDEKKYKDKFTKALYDIAAMAKAMFAEGASVQDVEQALAERT